MKNGKIRVGFIGAGNICQNAHIPAFLEQKDAELVAVCDIRAERAEEVRLRYGMKYATTSMDELVSIDGLDAVSVCTWNNAHAEAVIKAARAGKHILCEKPMCMNPGEAMEMKKAVDAAGVTFMMGFVNRFRGESVAVREAVESGLLGNVYYAKSSLLRRRGTPLGWFTDLSKSGGGPVIDIGVHMLDLTWYLMGRPEPVSVNACVHHELGDYKTKGVSRWEAFDTDDPVFETEDSADGLIRFKNGASILFDVSWAINCGVSDEMNVNLYGNKAGATVFPARLYGEAAGYLSDTALKTSDPQPFSGEIRHFLDCILTGSKPLAPIEDGVTVQRILNGIYDSAASGREVSV